MGKRFNNLEDTYNTLVAANFNFDSLSATNKYRKYAEWKQDPDKRKLPAGSSQDTGDRKSVGIFAFGIPYGDDAKLLIGMSGRAFNALPSVGTATLFGIDAVIAGYAPYPGFIPAKVILATKTATTSVPAASNRITGRAYKKRTGETFTVPYGPTAAGQTEFVRQEAIIANRAAAGSSGHQVTFTPERLRRV